MSAARPRPPSIRWLAAAALVVGLVALLTISHHRAGPRSAQCQPPRRPSAWVLPPRLTPWSVPAPDAPRPSGDHAGLGIRVEDVTGGAIPGALVSTGGDGGRVLGRTDEDGWIRIEASGLPAVIRVVARGEGYTEHSALAPVPGDTVIRLVHRGCPAG